MPNTPSIQGCVSCDFRVVRWVLRTVFPLVVRLVASLLLTGGVMGGPVLQSEINMAHVMLYSERRVGFF